MNVYDKNDLLEMLEQDAITQRECMFMLGYLAA